MKRNLYIDAEWYPNQQIFLIGYAHESGETIQLYGHRLTRKRVQKMLRNFSGTIFFYGPDIALLENHFKISIRNHYRCVNLIRIARLALPYAKSWKLAHLETIFGIKRNVAKYKKSIFQIYSDWNDMRYRKRVLQYNADDVQNLVLVKQKLFQRIAITRGYLESIRL